MYTVKGVWRIDFTEAGTKAFCHVAARNMKDALDQFYAMFGSGFAVDQSGYREVKAAYVLPDLNIYTLCDPFVSTRNNYEAEDAERRRQKEEWWNKKLQQSEAQKIKASEILQKVNEATTPAPDQRTIDAINATFGEGKGVDGVDVIELSEIPPLPPEEDMSRPKAVWVPPPPTAADLMGNTDFDSADDKEDDE